MRLDKRFGAFGVSVLCALLPLVAAGEERAEDWQFRATLYGYFPSIEGSTRFDTPVSEIDIEAGDLIENTEFAAMGSFEAQSGRFGAFTDVIYMDVGDSIDDATSLGQGSIPLPPGVTADASLDVRAWVWTIAANHRAVSTDRTTLDLFAGARLLDAEANLDVALNVGPQAAGHASRDNWDAIVGVKGRLNFGADGRWFVPYYLDVGTGDSDMTAQLATGVGYRVQTHRGVRGLALPRLRPGFRRGHEGPRVQRPGDRHLLWLLTLPTRSNAHDDHESTTHRRPSSLPAAGVPRGSEAARRALDRRLAPRARLDPGCRPRNDGAQRHRLRHGLRRPAGRLGR
jgi:hypothetical protein